METFLKFIKKYFIPKFIFFRLQPGYHFCLAFLGALFYGFPSYIHHSFAKTPADAESLTSEQDFGGQAKNLKVIGVTGTKGKTTTCNLIAQILNSSGFKTGMTTTVNFQIGGKEWINDSKQTMLGRFQLQKLLARMVKEGCIYAVIETSSEGILQYRHRFIDYDIAVFTNLTPEHIERHGSFHKYRAAKIKLFEKVAPKKDGVGIYNLDDPNIQYFLEPDIKNKYGYNVKNQKPKTKDQRQFRISNIKLSPDKTTFNFNDEGFEMPLIGEFNVYNAAAAVCAALSQNIPLEKIKTALKNAKPTSGRMEVIDKGQNFTVIVDYAHEPSSLEAVYKAITNLQFTTYNPQQGSKLICLLGGQGGGRDKWKRPQMGKIAAEYCDLIILTNEDPYDESPIQIINDVEKGISVNQRLDQRKSASIYKILDRREAIQKAVSLAQKGDVVVLTGKGGEVWICVENGKKIPWDERKIAGEAIDNLIFYKN